MAGKTPRELAHEFGVLRQRRPKLSRAVFHASLSTPATDRELSNAEWNEIAERFLHELGFSKAPYLVVKHADTDSHRHIHVLASRVDTDGNTVSDAHNYRRAEAALRAIEKDYGLTQVISSNTALPQQQKQRRQDMDENYRKTVEERLEQSSKDAKTRHQQVFESKEMGAGSGEEMSPSDLREIRRDMESKEYEERMRALFGDEVRYIDRPQLKHKSLRIIYFHNKGRITDEGNRLTAYQMSVEESSRRIVSIAISRGWKSLVLWGPDSFVECAMREAISNGLRVNPTNPAQERMLEAILSESDEGGGAGPAPEPTCGDEPVEKTEMEPAFGPPPPDLPPPSPFGEEIARKLANRRRREEEQRPPSRKRDGGITP